MIFFHFPSAVRRRPAETPRTLRTSPRKKTPIHSFPIFFMKPLQEIGTDRAMRRRNRHDKAPKPIG